MIDYREIYNTFIQVAAYSIGDKLSRTGDTGEFPAVIKARESQRTPEYPFITVNLRDTGNTTRHPLSEYTDTSGNTVVIYHRRMFLTYRVYGDDTQEITSELYSTFSLPSLRDYIQNSLPNTVIKNTLDILTLPILGSTKYIEMSEFQLELLVEESVVDPFSYAIGSVDFGLEVYENEKATTPFFTEDLILPDDNLSNL